MASTPTSSDPALAVLREYALPVQSAGWRWWLCVRAALHYVHCALSPLLLDLRLRLKVYSIILHF